MWSARSHAKFRVVSRNAKKNRSPQLAQPGPSQLVSSTTACSAQPFAARLINHSSPGPVLRSLYHSLQLAQLDPISSYHSPQLAQPGSSQLISSTTAGPSKLVSFTTARPARPFAARLIHHNSPSPTLRSSSHQPQLAQLGPSKLVSFTTARPSRPFEARLIHHSSPSPTLRSSSHQPQLALRNMSH